MLTDYDDNPYFKELTGHILIGITAFNIFVNMSIIVFMGVQELKNKLKLLN